MIKILLIFLANFFRSVSLRPTSRIIGGRPAKLGEYPMMAGIISVRSGLYICGGFLISPRYILSCAHCLVCGYYDTCSSRFKVLLGDIYHHSYLPSPYRQILGISHVALHYFYDDFSLINDIALVKLMGTVELSRYVQPVTLGGNRIEIGTECATIGWGVSDWDDDGLKATAVKILNESVCQIMPRFQPVKMICAGDLSGKNDSCFGDSGGPLLVNANVAVGIVSFGYGCATPNYGASYTNISNYRKWIDYQKVLLDLLPDRGVSLALRKENLEMWLKVFVVFIISL